MKARIYCRFSPRPNSDVCQSNDNQLQLAEKFCADKGWEVAASYKDDAISGKERDRPGLNNCLEDLRRGEVLVVKCWSRLSRDFAYGLMVLEDLLNRGVTVWSIEEGEHKTDPLSSFITSILMAVDAYRRAADSEETSNRMLQMGANGHRISAIPTYGWDVSKEDRTKLVRNEYQIAVIKRMLDLREKGMSYGKIASRLNAYVVPAPNGNTWHSRTVQRIIERERGAER